MPDPYCIYSVYTGTVMYYMYDFTSSIYSRSISYTVLGGSTSAELSDSGALGKSGSGAVGAGPAPPASPELGSFDRLGRPAQSDPADDSETHKITYSYSLALARLASSHGPILPLRLRPACSSLDLRPIRSPASADCRKVPRYVRGVNSPHSR